LGLGAVWWGDGACRLRAADADGDEKRDGPASLFNIQRADSADADVLCFCGRSIATTVILIVVSVLIAYCLHRRRRMHGTAESYGIQYEPIRASPGKLRSKAGGSGWNTGPLLGRLCVGRGRCCAGIWWMLFPHFAAGGRWPALDLKYVQPPCSLPLGFFAACWRPEAGSCARWADGVPATGGALLIQFPIFYAGDFFGMIVGNGRGGKRAWQKLFATISTHNHVPAAGGGVFGDGSQFLFPRVGRQSGFWRRPYVPCRRRTCTRCISGWVVQIYNASESVCPNLINPVLDCCRCWGDSEIEGARHFVGLRNAAGWPCTCRWCFFSVLVLFGANYSVCAAGEIGLTLLQVGEESLSLGRLRRLAQECKYASFHPRPCATHKTTAPQNTAMERCVGIAGVHPLGETAPDKDHSRSRASVWFTCWQHGPLLLRASIHLLKTTRGGLGKDRSRLVSRVENRKNRFGLNGMRPCSHAPGSVAFLHLYSSQGPPPAHSRGCIRRENPNMPTIKEFTIRFRRPNLEHLASSANHSPLKTSTILGVSNNSLTRRAKASVRPW